jgi:hypothetical protein
MPHAQPGRNGSEQANDAGKHGSGVHRDTQASSSSGAVRLAQWTGTEAQHSEGTQPQRHPSHATHPHATGVRTKNCSLHHFDGAFARCDDVPLLSRSRCAEIGFPLLQSGHPDSVPGLLLRCHDAVLDANTAQVCHADVEEMHV